MNVVFGFAIRHPDEPCAINTDRPERTLCGRDVTFLPPAQGFGQGDGIPVNLHPRCRALMGVFGGVVAADEVAYGACPDCHGDVPLVDGRVAAHGAWVVSRLGLHVSSVACSGEGELPEEER